MKKGEPIHYEIGWIWSNDDNGGDFRTQADLTTKEASQVLRFLKERALTDEAIADPYVEPYVEHNQTFTEVMAEIESAIYGDDYTPTNYFNANGVVVKRL